MLEQLTIKVKVGLGLGKELAVLVKTAEPEMERLKDSVVLVKMAWQGKGRLIELVGLLELALLRLYNLRCPNRRSCQMSYRDDDDDVRNPRVDGDDGGDVRHFCDAQAFCDAQMFCSATLTSDYRHLGPESKCDAP